ncbi:unnamed protein product, partial [Owenia fusiformis]
APISILPLLWSCNVVRGMPVWRAVDLTDWPFPINSRALRMSSSDQPGFLFLALYLRGILKKITIQSECNIICNTIATTRGQQNNHWALLRLLFHITLTLILR